MSEPPAAETERLYSLPLEEFTRERDELAKRLRSGGDRDAAAAIKALKKPSVAAWAVNQIRRDRPEDIRRLLDVTDELHRVYAGLAAAGARERLTEAADMQRDLIRSLVKCAGELLEAGGHGASDATLTKVAETLRAAALDQELREQVARGQVVREQSSAGLGPLASVPAPSKSKSKSKKKAKKAATARKPPEPPKPDPEEVRKAELEVEEARRALQAAEKRRKRLG